MECVRVGILHHRKEILLRLPVGTVLEGEGSAVLVDGDWQISALTRDPGLSWTGLKVLECGDEELLALAHAKLSAAGLDVLDCPHAPGRAWADGTSSPATRLLLVPVVDPFSFQDCENHVSRETPRAKDEERHSQVLKALGKLANRASQKGPPALWFSGSPQRHRVTAAAPIGKLLLRGPSGRELQVDEPVRFHLPEGDTASIKDVRVGIGFHWDHQETLEYGSCLECRLETGGALCLINELDIELYLAAVNSSEMNADCPQDLLMAQTVAARSTLFATRGRHHADELFDLCADDHCQCFRGESVIREESLLAARETAGCVLAWNGLICDSRYSKSCGGITESYEYAWEDQSIPYMPSLCDTVVQNGSPRLRPEEDWLEYIKHDEDVCCNTERKALTGALEAWNGYYQWTIQTNRVEVAEQIRRVTGYEFKHVFDLVPEQRGFSGRISRLKVVTEKGVFWLGKELTIRRALWSACLYSSLVHFEWKDEELLIHGKGWGHGVGMCQLGALNQARSGRTWQEILAHYYPGSELRKLPETTKRTNPA